MVAGGFVVRHGPPGTAARLTTNGGGRRAGQRLRPYARKGCGGGIQRIGSLGCGGGRGGRVRNVRGVLLGPPFDRLPTDRRDGGGGLRGGRAATRAAPTWDRLITNGVGGSQAARSVDHVARTEWGESQAARSLGHGAG